MAPGPTIMMEGVPRFVTVYDAVCKAPEFDMTCQVGILMGALTRKAVTAPVAIFRNAVEPLVQVDQVEGGVSSLTPQQMV